MFLVPANMASLGFSPCKKKNFWETSLQKFLFLKLVLEPIFLLIWQVFAYVAYDDCVKLATGFTITIN